MKEIIKENKSFINKIFIIIGFVLTALFLYKISNVLFILILSFFLTVLFSPFLNKLNKWKINDLIWIIIIFTWLLFIISLTMFLVIPLIVNQGIVLFNSIWNGFNSFIQIYQNSWIEGYWLPLIIEDFVKGLNIEVILNLIKENYVQISTFLWTFIKKFASGWIWIIFSFTSSLLNFVLIFLFTFFIVLERKKIREFFYAILPKDLSKYFYENENKIINMLNTWLKWQLILGMSMFSLTLIWLLILKLFWIHIPWIISLALISWFMEFIPFIWTTVSIFLALSISLWVWLKWFIGVLIVYLIIQQIEWNFLVPYIM